MVTCLTSRFCIPVSGETGIFSVQTSDRGAIIAVIRAAPNRVTGHTNANSPLTLREKSVTGGNTEIKKTV